MSAERRPAILTPSLDLLSGGLLSIIAVTAFLTYVEVFNPTFSYSQNPLEYFWLSAL